MNVLAFNGSPRRKGNTSLLLHELLRGAYEVGANVEEIIAEDINLKYCKGCLKCNLLKRCAITGDDWPLLHTKIINSDILIFASPVYFHHLTAPIKKILDRFRSFINVQITENGLIHTPWNEWRKNFVLLLCMGSSVETDAIPVINLFEFITSILGEQNKLTTITGTRLAVANQILMTEDELSSLYPKLGLPSKMAAIDYKKNQMLIKKCRDLGRDLLKSI